jgi:hypothetical protein
MRMTPRRILLPSVLAVGVLGAFGSALHGQPPAKSVSIAVDDPRPLAAAVRVLEQRYHCVITYEDPLFLSLADGQDVTEQVRRDGNLASRVFIPRGGPFRFTLSTDIDGRGRRLAVLRSLLQQFGATGYPGVFRILRTGEALHVVPTTTRNATGTPEPCESLFDVTISIPAEKRTADDMVSAVLNEVRRVAGRDYVVGIAPTNLLLNDVRIRSASDEVAGLVLQRTLEEADPSLSWRALCAPGTDRRGFVNIYSIN